MTQEEQLDEILQHINRFEVIDHKKDGKGRIVVEYGVKVEVSIQDGGRTMKVFLTNQNK